MSAEATRNVSAYLQLLASLARLGQQPGHLAQLRWAENVEAILAVPGQIRMRRG